MTKVFKVVDALQFQGAKKDFGSKYAFFSSMGM